MVLDATVGGSSANSFITRVDAINLAPIVAPSSEVSKFSCIDGDSQDILIMRATRMIERSFEWSGSRSYSSQLLSWPRADVSVDGELLDADVIPQQVLDATVLLTLYLMNGYSASSGLATAASKVKVGPIEVTMDDSKSKSRSAIPEDVISLMGMLGDYTGVTSGMKTLSLVRA